MSPPVLVVLGAGRGLGAAVARRFGREGFRVALVGRRPEPLRALEGALREDGIEAAPFGADLQDPSQAADLVARVRERFGRIDVLEYGPVSADLSLSPTRELSADALARAVSLYLLTPVELSRLGLPEMVERDAGSILVTLAASGLTPAAGTPGSGIAQVAVRHYLRSLALELKDTGVYVGSVAVGALILGSEVAGFAEGALPPDVFAQLPVVKPEEVAELHWTLHNVREQHEATIPSPS